MTPLQEAIDRLGLEIEELRASRKRLVAAADADRRRIERELHEGVQQHLVALAVNLQLLGQLADSDPPAAKTLLDEVARDVEEALDEAAQLAQAIYPPLLDSGGLAVALRAAGKPVSVELTPGAGYPPAVSTAVYWCCIEALERVGDGERATISVREQERSIDFVVVRESDLPGAALDRLRDRVEALDGTLKIEAEPGRGTSISGRLPLSG